MRASTADRMDRQRRNFLQGLMGLVAMGMAPAGLSLAGNRSIHLRRIPSSGEMIPALGMGTWITFNTPPLTEAREQRVRVLKTFFDLGGTLVDSSPMYGFAEATVGHCLDQLGDEAPVFSATKVWTPTRVAGEAQMKASLRLWNLDSFDLMQVHNMVDWETHLETLGEWKDDEKIRYIGITTSHGRRHARMERVIAGRPEFDFVQFTYNIADREAEQRLLPAAADNGKAVIVNRPFRRGGLFRRVRGKALPRWAADIGCENWAQYFLKFAISHPAVTCAIPATSRVDHMLENMGALRGPLPDAVMRRRMINYFVSL